MGVDTDQDISDPKARVAEVEAFFQRLQQDIVSSLEAAGAGNFVDDSWESTLGIGRTMVVSGAGSLERGAVNYSRVSGDSLPAAASAARPQLAGLPFDAMGVSVVLHPSNPYAPTVHMNVRFFIAGTGEGQWWFGGGMDLTPCYGFEDDARDFHRACRDAVVPFGDGLYGDFKKRCDDYFHLKHRDERRGVGGIFFDDFSEGGFSEAFALVRSVGSSFTGAYEPILTRRKDMPYGERERAFQLYRRGRYVEFNLVYDRGTLFGLQSGGRAESILVSMPPLARWEYCWEPEPNSPEARFAEEFLVPRDWV